VNILQPSKLVESGPIVGTICSAPPIVASSPFMGRRPVVGFKPYTPIFSQKYPVKFRDKSDHCLQQEIE
jgi:hypothetical protein